MATFRATELADRNLLLAEAEKKRREEVELLLYASRVSAALRDWDAGEPFAAWRKLDACSRSCRGWECDFVYTSFTADHETLHKHAATVRDVAFSSSGTMAASCSDDGSSLIWDPALPERKRSLLGHTASVAAVDLNDDGPLVVSGGYDRKAVVWDVTTGDIVSQVGKHRGGVSAVAFSPDGSRIASCDRCAQRHGGKSLVHDTEAIPLVLWRRHRLPVLSRCKPRSSDARTWTRPPCRGTHRQYHR